MRISFGQILIVIIIFTLMFSDIKNIKKYLFLSVDVTKKYFSKKKNRKKGI